jgi:hypothetical protein
MALLSPHKTPIISSDLKDHTRRPARPSGPSISSAARSPRRQHQSRRGTSRPQAARRYAEGKHGMDTAGLCRPRQRQPMRSV